MMKSIAIVAAMLLSGCAHVVQGPTDVVEAPKNVLVLPRPDPVKVLDFEWEVYGKGDSAAAAKYVESKALVCLTPEGYENLSKNVAEMQRYINQLKAVVEQYEKDRKSSQ